MDAQSYHSNPESQFETQNIVRDLNKSYCAFSASKTNQSAIATGNWGCGIFQGNVHGGHDKDVITIAGKSSGTDSQAIGLSEGKGVSGGKGDDVITIAAGMDTTPDERSDEAIGVTKSSVNGNHGNDVISIEAQASSKAIGLTRGKVDGGTGDDNITIAVKAESDDSSHPASL